MLSAKEKPLKNRGWRKVSSQENEERDYELWSSIVRKAMAYDLLNLLKAENKTYTYEDLKQIIYAYV